MNTSFTNPDTENVYSATEIFNYHTKYLEQIMCLLESDLECLKQAQLNSFV